MRKFGSMISPNVKGTLGICAVLSSVAQRIMIAPALTNKNYCGAVCTYALNADLLCGANGREEIQDDLSFQEVTCQGSSAMW